MVKKEEFPVIHDNSENKNSNNNNESNKYGDNDTSELFNHTTRPSFNGYSNCSLEQINIDRVDYGDNVINLGNDDIVFQHYNDDIKENGIDMDEAILLTQNDLKYDFYEKGSDELVICVYVKNVIQEIFSIDFLENSLTFRFKASNGKFSDRLYCWTIDLENEIIPSSCYWIIYQQKIEIILKKKTTLKWGRLVNAKNSTDKCFNNDQDSSLNSNYRKATLPTDVWIQAGQSSGDVVDAVPLGHPPVPPPSPPTQSNVNRRNRLVLTSNNQTNTSKSKLKVLDDKLADDRLADDKLMNSSPPPSSSSSSLNKFVTNISPTIVGYTGLTNLGNTCFMNAVLQCLSNTEELRDYFMSHHFKDDINETNPLGTGGKIAYSFSALLGHLWSGKHSSYSPSKLKSLMGEKMSQFSGFAQHDAQEYMAYLLDALHEDVNRIKQKPYDSNSVTDSDDDNQIPEEVQANEAWRKYRKRNDSVIVDLFQGQYKSKLHCPICKKISITFDPFLYLSIPLPKNQANFHHQVYFFPLNSSKKPIKYVVRLPGESRVAKLLEVISTRSGVNVNNLEAILVSSGKVEEYLSVDKLIPDLRHSSSNVNENILAFEVLNKDEHQVCKIFVHQQLKEPILPANNQCTHCSKSSANLKRCTKCYQACYCDQNCQKSDWADHKLTCGTQAPQYVGCPFILTIPKSEFSINRIEQLVYAYSRYSVDITKQKRKESIDENKNKPKLEEIDSDDAFSDFSNEDLNEVTMKGVDSLNSSISNNSDEDLSDEENDKDFCFLIYNEKKNFFESPESFFGTDNLGLLNLDEIPDELNMNIEWQNGKNNKKRLVVETKYDPDHSYDIYEENKINIEVNKKTLENCLKLFTEPEVLSPQEAWYCSRCKQHREATKQLSLWRLPPILIIQLKRFSFRNLLFRDKIDKFIDFPLKSLDLTEFCAERPEISQEQKPLYDLYAVIDHFGGMFGGHYTATAKTSKNGLQYSWRLFDDYRVTDSSEDEVVTKNAYILFYRLRE